ncbi:MAG: hypothetical protein AAGC55_05755 [Myxococcota bacterium]
MRPAGAEGAATADATTQTTPDGDELAPRPFNAEQIRAATPAGRSYRFRVENQDGSVRLLQMTFMRVDERGATLQQAMYDADGKPAGQAQTSEVTWPELVGHANYPREATVISDARIETPAGAFDCMLYTVTEQVDGRTQVTRAYFARELPGAPVVMRIEVAGQPMISMTLVEHRPQ